MATSLIANLRALSADDLEILLQRRPEVRHLVAGKRRTDFASLSDILSKPQGIHIAVASLNGFLTQLLQLGLWLGPRAAASAIADQAPGVCEEDLRAGAEELSRWGLAFLVDSRHPGGEQSPEWVLEVPDCTMATAAMPAGYGTLGRRLLSGRSTGFVSTVARHIGLPDHPHSGPHSMVAEVAAALSEPDRVADLLGEAPPKAAELFGRVQAAGGAISRHELMTTGAIRWSDPAWGEKRKILTPLDWLESRGLLMLDPAVTYTGAVVIPAEVQLALRGGRLFATWPRATPPPLIPLVEVGTGPAPTGLPGTGDPSKILAEMETLLEEWSQNPPPSLQRGGLGVRELRKTARAVGWPERYLSFLYALGAEAGLIGVDEEGRVVPTDDASDWAEQPAALRWSILFETWLSCSLWFETEPEGLVRLDRAQPALWIDRLRRGLVEELACLPEGVVTDTVRLADRLAWRYPALVDGGDNGAELMQRAAEALVWLGTAAVGGEVGTGPGSPPTQLCLLEPGRSAIVEKSWFGTPGPGLAAFAPEVATCTVGADLNIIVPGPPVHALRSALGRFAELKASSPARIYRLSEASLRRGLDAGLAAADILAVLQHHAPKGIPQNVAYLIEDVGRRHGQLVAGATGLYLRSDDPGLLRTAVGDRRLAAFRPRLLAPTVAVLDGDSVPGLLAALRSAGYFPVAESGGGALHGSASPARVKRLWHAFRPLDTLTRSEAAELAGAIGRGPSSPRAKQGTRSSPAILHGVGEFPALDGRRVQARPQIRELTEVAVDRELVLEISYRSADGNRTQRCIEPMELTSLGVDAWCRLRDDERHFVLSRIEWARVTGEHFGPDERSGEGDYS